PFAQQLSRKPRSSSPWAPLRSALQQWRAGQPPGLASAGRSGSRRARSRSCSKRTGSFDNKPEPPDQAGSTLHLASFEAASRFETLVIILYDPAVFIPPNALGIPAQASWWAPRSAESIPRAPLRLGFALPTPAQPKRSAGLCHSV